LIELRKHVVELSSQQLHQLMQKCLLKTKVGIIVTHCPSQDAADNVAGPRIGRQLPVSDSEGYRPDMIGQYAESYSLFAVAAIVAHIGYPFDFLDSSGKHIGIVVAAFIL